MKLPALCQERRAQQLTEGLQVAPVVVTVLAANHLQVVAAEGLKFLHLRCCCCAGPVPEVWAFLTSPAFAVADLHRTRLYASFCHAFGIALQLNHDIDCVELQKQGLE